MRKKTPAKGRFSLFSYSENTLVILLAAFSFFLYVNTLWNQYNLDDELVTRNHHLTSKGIAAIPEIFSSPYYQDQMGYKFEYRPVVLASFAIEHTFFGEHPAISHLINVVLYVITVVMLFYLLKRLFTAYDNILPFVTCLIFAAHPLHTEVVANIKNRDEILALLFGLASWHMSIRFVLQSEKRWLSLLLAALCFLLAMFSKQSIMSLAFLIPLSFVMFYETQTSRLLLCSGIMAFITALIMPLEILLQKVALFLLLTVSPWLFKHLFLTSSVRRVYLFLKERLLLFASAQEKENVPSFLFTWQIPTTTGIILLVSLFFFIGISIYLAWTALLYWTFIAAFLLTLINAHRDIAGWLLIASCLPAMMLHDWHHNGAAYDLFLLYLFFVTIIFNHRFPLRFVYLSYGIVILYALLRMDQLIAPYVLFLVVFFIIKSRKAFYVLFGASLVKIIAAAYHIIASVVNNSPVEFLIYEELVPAVIAAIVLGLYFIEKSRRISYYILFVSVMVVYTYYFLYRAPGFIGINEIQQLRHTTINLLPESDRPILFQEMPVRFDTPLSEKLGTGFYVLAEYLKLMIFPHPLSFYYGYAYIVPVGITHPQAIASALIHIAMLLLALWLVKRNRVISYALLFYLGSIVVFSNIVYPVVGIMADRLTYVSTIGFCLLIGYLLLQLFKIPIKADNPVKFKPAFLLVLIAILTAYSIKTVSRNAKWKNHLTLMRHDIKHLEKSAQAHNLLAQNIMKYSFEKEYANQVPQMYREAIEHFKKSADIYPHFLNVWYDMGRVYVMLNEKDSAYNCFIKAHQIDSTFAFSAFNAALIAEEKMNYEEAIQYYESAIRNDPLAMSEAFARLSYLYYRLGNFEKSIATNKKAIQFFPQQKGFFENLAKIYYQLKDTANAEFYKREARKRY